MMKTLFLIFLLSGCVAEAGSNWDGVYEMCSPDGVAHWRSNGSLTPRIDKEGKPVKCQP